MSIKNKIRSEIIKKFPVSYNGVLKNDLQWQIPKLLLQSLRLPVHTDAGQYKKNWDTLKMIKAVLNHSNEKDNIFDAGSEKYSPILKILERLGYKNLYGMNLAFESNSKQGNINYINGDITKTDFPDEYFSAITCQSVIEHGVNLKDYLSEMCRLLKKGGVLVTSTDYFDTQIDTQGKTYYNAPITIFSRAEMANFLSYARRVGFTVNERFDFSSPKKIVTWDKVGLSYTFINFTFIKPV